jgi:hypothetical protein
MKEVKKLLRRGKFTASYDEKTEDKTKQHLWEAQKLSEGKSSRTRRCCRRRRMAARRRMADGSEERYGSEEEEGSEKRCGSEEEEEGSEPHTSSRDKWLGIRPGIRLFSACLRGAPCATAFRSTAYGIRPGSQMLSDKAIAIAAVATATGLIRGALNTPSSFRSKHPLLLSL